MLIFPRRDRTYSTYVLTHRDGDEEGCEQQGPEAHRHGYDDSLGTHGVWVLGPVPDGRDGLQAEQERVAEILDFRKADRQYIWPEYIEVEHGQEGVSLLYGHTLRVRVDPPYLHDQGAKDDTRDDEGQEGDRQEGDPVHPEQDAVVPQSYTPRFYSFDGHIYVAIFFHNPRAARGC